MISCRGIVGSPSFPVVLLLFMLKCAEMGITKSIGLYIKDITNSLNTRTPTDIGIELGLYIAFTCLPGPIVIALYRKQILRRMLLIVGSVFFPIGVILTSLAGDSIQIAIFLSISGLGVCIMTQCCMLTLSSLASPYFNILYSIAVSGIGVGMVLLPFVAESLRVTYGWRGGLLIIGALTANLIPCAVAVRVEPGVETTVDVKNKVPASQSKIDLEVSVGTSKPTDDDRIAGENVFTASKNKPGFNNHVDKMDTSPLVTSHLSSVNRRDENEEVGNDQRSVLGTIMTNLRKADCYSDPIFTLVFFNALLFGQVYSGWHAFLVPHVLQRGISVQHTIVLTFCASLGNITGRILAGTLSNNLFNAVTLFLAATLVNIAALLCDVFIPHYYVMLLTSFISAASIAMRAVLACAIILKERASPENFDIAIAAFAFVYGFGLLFGGYLSGVVADLYSSYDAVFKLLAGMDSLVFVCMLPPGIIKKHSS